MAFGRGFDSPQLHQIVPALAVARAVSFARSTALSPGSNDAGRDPHVGIIS